MRAGRPALSKTDDFRALADECQLSYFRRHFRGMSETAMRPDFGPFDFKMAYGGDAIDDARLWGTVRPKARQPDCASVEVSPLRAVGEIDEPLCAWAFVMPLTGVIPSFVRRQEQVANT